MTNIYNHVLRQLQQLQHEESGQLLFTWPEHPNACIASQYAMGEYNPEKQRINSQIAADVRATHMVSCTHYTRPEQLSDLDLIAEAVNRCISPHQPFDHMCREINQMMPSREWIAAQNEFMNSLDPVDLDIILSYTDAAAQSFNTLLRTGELPYYERRDINDVRLVIDRFTEILLAAPVVDKPFTVYRGVGGIKYVFADTKGNVYTSQAFVSTSLYTGQILMFTEQVEDESGPVVLEIIIPAGTPAIFYGSKSMYSEQDEVLLNRGQQFKILCTGQRSFIWPGATGCHLAISVPVIRCIAI